MVAMVKIMYERLRHRRILIGSLTCLVGLVFLISHVKSNCHQTESSGTPTETDSHGIASLGFTHKEADSPEDKAQKSAELTTVPVEIVECSSNLRLTGSLLPEEKSQVASNVTGIVLKVLVDRGSVVKKGDILVQLDPTDAQNRLNEGLALADELRMKLGIEENPSDGAAFNPLEQPEVKLAKTALNLAETKLKRSAKLLEKQAISVEEHDQHVAEAESAAQRYRQAILLAKQIYQSYQTAIVRLAALRKAVADTTIIAPFDGIIAEKHVTVGEQVMPNPLSGGAKVATLVRMDPVRLSLTVPQQNVQNIQPGQKVKFRVDSFPQEVFTADVVRISPIVTTDTRSLVIEAQATNADGRLRPGLFITAEVELPKQHKEFYVPASAVQRQGEVGKVFVVRNDVVREQNRRPRRNEGEPNRGENRPDRKRPHRGESRGGRRRKDGA